MENERILILDFGGQYNQLIARRVRECHVYCEVRPHDMPLSEIRAFDPVGIIFTGGPHSVYEPGAPDVDPGVFALGVPILGICYGCQLMAARLGGEVIPAQSDSAREYGKTDTEFDTGSPVFQGLPARSITWMSHGDYLSRVPEGFSVLARSAACPSAAIGDDARRFYGVQFHPEVRHTAHGLDLLKNFLYAVCGAKGSWTMENYRAKGLFSAECASGTAGCCSPSPAAWIPRSAQRFCPRRWGTSSPAFSWTTDFCARARATRWRRRLPPGR